MFVARLGGSAMRRSHVHSRRHRRLIALAAAVAAGALLGSTAASAAAPAAVTPRAVTDSCSDQCSDVLPPGENGAETLADILVFKLLGIRPSHNNDQLSKYSNLASSYTGLTNAQIDTFYNDSSLGVPASQIERTETPEAGVTIIRDKNAGIPHI